MSKKTITKLKNRSKKYSKNYQLIKEVLEPSGAVSLDKGVTTLFSLDQPNYKDGSSVELHVKLNIDSTKSDQIVRGSVVLPHGNGKKVVVAAFVTANKEKEAKDAGADMVGGDELIEQIKKDGVVRFDKAVAEPEMMKKLAPIARLLGTAGAMPNPKTGTVGENIGEIVSAIKKGKIDFKNDKGGNLHFSCGKINKQFNPEKIMENLTAILDSVNKSKPEGVKKKYVLKVSLCSSLSPNIPIAL